MIINELYISGLKRLCRNNIEIVDAVFETHLKLIAAHGVDMQKAIDYYKFVVPDKENQVQTDPQAVPTNGEQTNKMVRLST